MTPEQFVYWLQGFYEISGNELAPTSRDIIIRDHLKEVFSKRTPERGSYTAPNAPYQSPNAVPMPPYHFPNQGQAIC